MQVTSKSNLANKQLIVFDLDGTLAPTKSTIDTEMGKLIEDLLNAKKVAVIGGGKFQLFEEQLLNDLNVSNKLKNSLFLFPTTATTFYRWDKGWKQVYAHSLSEDEVKKTMTAFKKAVEETGYKPEKTYGITIENRGTQVTWSALGQDVVKELGSEGVELKNKWKEENTPLKLKIAKLVQEQVPGLEVHSAGYTSIDVTKKGIDKAYGLHQMEKYLNIPINNMLFVGDAIFPGGNDYAVTKTPIDYIAVKDPGETKEVIRQVLGKNT